MSLVCQKCYKSQDVLEALGKLRYVQGYAQCRDCGSDLESESVVIRQIHIDNERLRNIPYPQWFHNELQQKGLLESIDILTENERVLISKCIN